MLVGPNLNWGPRRLFDKMISDWESEERKRVKQVKEVEHFRTLRSEEAYKQCVCDERE